MIRLYGRYLKIFFVFRKGWFYLYDCLYFGGGCDWMWGVKVGKFLWKEFMER